MSTNIREVNYVCDPAGISIKVEYVPLQAGNRITFYVDKQPIFQRVYRAYPTPKKEDFHLFTENCCEMFFRHMDEDIFSAAAAPKDYLRVKYLHQHIRIVYNKAGTSIWKK